MAEVQHVVEGYLVFGRDPLTYLDERVNGMGTGVSASLVVSIYGHEMDNFASTPDASTLRSEK